VAADEQSAKRNNQLKLPRVTACTYFGHNYILINTNILQGMHSLQAHCQGMVSQ
jgi:hypothetical protein